MNKTTLQFTTIELLLFDGDAEATDLLLELGLLLVDDLRLFDPEFSDVVESDDEDELDIEVGVFGELSRLVGLKPEPGIDRTGEDELLFTIRFTAWSKLLPPPVCGNELSDGGAWPPGTGVPFGENFE